MKKININLKEKLANLVFEYDNLRFHICPKIEEMYLLSFGFLECEAYNLDIELDMTKKHIDLLNQGFDVDEIEDKIDDEFDESIEMLEKYMDELNQAIEKKDDFCKLSDEELNSLNALYLELIYRLNPYFNPVQSFYEKDLYEEIVESFENYDLKTMRSLKVLLPEDSTIFNDDDAFIIAIDELNHKISDIKNSYPYNKKDILENDELFTEYKIYLTDIVASNYLLIEEYREKLERLFLNLNEYSSS